MKKFSQTVETIREINEKELSELQKSYREYFSAKMNKFGVKSPAEMTEDQKKDFFNEITKDWEKGKGATETGKKDVEKHGVKEGEEVNESVLAIAGGVILGILGLKVIANIFKSVSAGIALRSITDPGKMKQIADQISSEAMSNQGKNPLQVALWQKAVIGMIDKGEIKNAYELAKTIKGIDDIDIKKVFENEDVNEAKINEKDIKNKEDFAAFVKDKLKKVHGKDYDEKKAQEVIDGLSKEAEKDGDWGAAIGKLNKA